jgi:hypothetical protein
LATVGLPEVRKSNGMQAWFEGPVREAAVVCQRQRPDRCGALTNFGNRFAEAWGQHDQNPVEYGNQSYGLQSLA